MLGFGHKYDLAYKCDVKIDCPTCAHTILQLHWASKRFALLGIPTVKRGEGYFLKCEHWKHGTLYGPLTPGVADELQGQK